MLSAYKIKQRSIIKIKLPLDLIFNITKYLDSTSLYLLLSTSKNNMEMLDEGWEVIINYFFSEEKLNQEDHLKKTTLNYYSLFNQLLKTSYPNFDKRKNRLYLLIKENNFEKLKQETITNDDIECLIPTLIDSNHEELKKYVYDQFKITEQYPITKLIEFGLQLQLTHDRIKDYIKSNLGNHSIYSCYYSQHTINSSLAFAAQYNVEAIVKFILQQENSSSQLCKDVSLFVAASKGHLNIVKLLVAHHANIHFFNGIRFMVITIAAKEGHRDVVQYLHEYGIDITDAIIGSRVLSEAMQTNQLNVVDYLLCHNVNLGQSVFGTPLNAGVNNDSYKCVKRLLEKNADSINTKSSSQTPLCVAAKRGNAAMCELLIQYGADVNLVSNLTTALHCAVESNKIDVVKVLLKNSANVNALGSYKETPLFKFMTDGCYDIQIAELLLEYGAECKKQNLVAYIVRHSPNAEHAKLLFKYGAEFFYYLHQEYVKDLELYAKITALKLIATEITSPFNCQRVTLSFNVAAIAEKIKSNLSARCIANDLFSKSKSDFEYLVVLYSILIANLFDAKLQHEIVHAMKFESIELAQTNLYAALETCLGNDEAINILKKYVINSICDLLEYEETFNFAFTFLNNLNYIIYFFSLYINEDNVDSVLFNLSYFEGQIRRALPNQKNIFNTVLRADEVVSHLDNILDIFNEPAAKRLKINTHFILSSNVIDEASKLVEIKKIIIEYHNSIVEINRNGNKLFTGCSILGNALENFLKDVFKHSAKDFVLGDSIVSDYLNNLSMRRVD